MSILALVMVGIGVQIQLWNLPRTKTMALATLAAAVGYWAGVSR